VTVVRPAASDQKGTNGDRGHVGQTHILYGNV